VNHTPTGTAALRRAYEIAVDLEARPLLTNLDVLAKNAHVPTTAVAVRRRRPKASRA
jgi:hypothetical protein